MNSNEMAESVKQELQNIDTIIDIKHNPVISSFVSLLKKIPYLGALIDDSIEHSIKDFQNKKQEQLLDVINNATIGTVTSDRVNDVEFIMGFAKTYNAVNKLLNGDKVRFYGNLLANGYLNEKEKILTDEFEEYLELINSLSYRELEYLSFFKKFSDKHNGRLVNQDWKNFCIEFQNKFPCRDVNTVYKRLQQTGFIGEVIEPASVEGETLNLGIYSVGFEVGPEFSHFNDLVLEKL